MQSHFAVIFDMDGVLFDSESVYIEGYVKFASEYDDIEEVCRSCIGANGRKTKEIFLERYGEEFPFDPYYQKVKDYVRSHPIPLKDGAVEILSFLNAHGVPLALASSTSSPSVEKMLNEADLTRYFDQIICGDMVSHSKPHPEIFLVAAQKLRERPENCFVIEDSFNGVRAAFAAGMQVVMVPDVMQPNDEMREKADLIFEDLFEAKEYFSERIKSNTNNGKEG